MLTYVVIHLALAPWWLRRREGGGRNTRCDLGQYADMAGGMGRRRRFADGL